MGIDIYLKWDGMNEKDEKDQVTGFSTTAGEVGYLREAYHGGPYATKMLVREAFEAENCEAQIPAKVLRERLTNVTEPARGCDAGHMVAMLMADAFQKMGAQINEPPKSGETAPMTVEEAIRERCARLYPESGSEYADQVVRSFHAFVELAEKKEAETGKPCTVYASY
ncbi:hypothetical protein EBZ39_00295 [bacterium]|nr:hypothetical protein [bacterium]